MEFPPSFLLLLDCLSDELGQSEKFMQVAVAASEWQELVALSEVHGVTPLVYHRLTRSAEHLTLPEGILPHLQGVYLQNLKRNMRLYQDLGKILKELTRNQIPVLPLKGAYLAEKVYGNIGLRPMVDLDLLLPRPDLAKALDILKGLGYQAKYPFDIDLECQTEHHLPQLFRERSVKLEIHWTLAPTNTPFHINIQELWDRSQPSTLGGVEIFAMDPADLLLYLCLHAAYLDNFSNRLRPYCDITWTMREFGDQLDWEQFTRQAEGWGAARSAWLALRLANRLLGIQLPPMIEEHLRPAGYDPVPENWAIEQILSPSNIGPKLAAAWAPQPWKNRLAHIARSLFPPRWEMRQNYPRLAHGLNWSLAYASHLLVVIRHHWRTAWRMVRGDNEVKAAFGQRSRVNLLMEWQSGTSEGE